MPRYGIDTHLPLLEGLQRQNPLFLFYEPWMDEVIPINPNFWATVVTGTGTVARDATEAGILKVILNCPAGVDTARLRGIQRWRGDATNMRSNSIAKKVVMQWMGRLVNPANVNVGVSILGGLTSGLADTKPPSMLVNGLGFALWNPGPGLWSWYTGGNPAGAITLGDFTAFDVTQWLLFKIELFWEAITSTNPAARFTVTNAAGLTQSFEVSTLDPGFLLGNLYPQFYVVSSPAVACQLHIGELSAAYYDNVLT